MKKLSAIPSKVRDVEDGTPFVQISSELLRSPAWRGQSINCHRLVEFLMAEHMAHAGLENGYLLATYDQLVEWGIGRRLIHSAIGEAERRGLAEVERGGRKGFTETALTRFRLTFLKAKRFNPDGSKYYITSTNEWRRYREPDRKIKKQGYEGELSQCTIVNFHSSPSCTQRNAKSAEISHRPIVHEGEPPITSWRGTPTTADTDQTSLPPHHGDADQGPPPLIPLRRHAGGGS